MRSVVTGAGGFLGSHLVDLLLKEKHEVLGVDSFITGDRRNLAHLEHHYRFELVERNVCDRAEVSGTIDYVFHLASPASPVDCAKYPIETLRAGSMGTLQWLEAAVTKGARFLLAS